MRDLPCMHLDKTGLAQSKSTKRVCRFIPGFRYVPWLVLWFIALLILSNVILPSHRNTAYAEQNDNSRWDNVKAWKGTISITGAYQGSAEGWDEITIQNSMNGSVNLSNQIFTNWYGYINGSYSINEKFVTYDIIDCDRDGKYTDDYIETVKGGGSISEVNFLGNSSFGLGIDKYSGLYNLDYGSLLVDTEETFEGCTTSTKDANVIFSATQKVYINPPLPESGLTLSGSKNITLLKIKQRIFS